MTITLIEHAKQLLLNRRCATCVYCYIDLNYSHYCARNKAEWKKPQDSWNKNVPLKMELNSVCKSWEDIND
jgi:hypothetical protein